MWFILGRQALWHGGPSGPIPVPGDYNGDGAAEATLWVPQTG